jgi:deazaflavin-dependent oxidoreductase (nitroreductase family)
MSDVVDSPVGHVGRHIRRYVETGGEEGHEWRPGVPTLLLTTKGRRSGVKRRTALIYGRDNADYVVIASKGGAVSSPAWYHNLVANPEVTVEVGTDTYQARASVAERAGRERAEGVLATQLPFLAEHEQRAGRQIPIVVLERVGAGATA